MINILIGNVDLCTLKLGFDYLFKRAQWISIISSICWQNNATVSLFWYHHIHDKHCHKMLQLWHLLWPISVANKLSYYRLYYYFTLSVQWALLDALYSATLDTDIESTLLDIFFQVCSPNSIYGGTLFSENIYLLIYDLIEL